MILPVSPLCGPVLFVLCAIEAIPSVFDRKVWGRWTMMWDPRVCPLLRALPAGLPWALSLWGALAVGLSVGTWIWAFVGIGEGEAFPT